jgi:hypothetical protein
LRDIKEQISDIRKKEEATSDRRPATREKERNKRKRARQDAGVEVLWLFSPDSLRMTMARNFEISRSSGVKLEFEPQEKPPPLKTKDGAPEEKRKPKSAARSGCATARLE